MPNKQQRKIVVNNHRWGVKNYDVSQFLTVATRTFDHEHPNDGTIENGLSRIEFAKKALDLIEALGEDWHKYADAFPSEWDIDVKG